MRRDAQANRDRIVAAARDAFADEGIDVPVEEIARRAGVGMGTLYRHFAAKEDLIDAVFAESIGKFVEAAQEALVVEDAWAGFCGFLERALVLHFENSGLKDVVVTRAHGRARLEEARAQMRPLVRELVERAQAQGTLRADFSPTDVSMLFWTGARVIEATASVAPGAWRRYLGMQLDGLRAEAATPLPHPPLTQAQVDKASVRKPR